MPVIAPTFRMFTRIIFAAIALGFDISFSDFSDRADWMRFTKAYAIHTSLIGVADDRNDDELAARKDFADVLILDSDFKVEDLLVLVVIAVNAVAEVDR